MEIFTFAVLVVLNVATFVFSVIAPLMRSDKHLNLCVGIAILASAGILSINELYGLALISIVGVIRQGVAYRYAGRENTKPLMYAAHAIAIVSVLVTLSQYKGWPSLLGAIDNVLCAYGFILLTGFKLRALILLHGCIWTTIGVHMGAPGVVGAASFMGVTSLWAMYEIKHGRVHWPLLDRALGQLGIHR